MKPIPTETRRYVWERDGHRCIKCGAAATQIAHRIPNTKTCEKMYGMSVVNSPANLALACGLECNKALQAKSWDWDAIAAELSSNA